MAGQPRQVVLEWNRPPLHSAADWLAEKLADQSLSADAILALPTARANQRLRQLLSERSVASKKLTIVTIGSLPELLYRQVLPHASHLRRHLAWVEALRALPPRRREEAFPNLDSEDLARLSSLATRLQSLHERLGAETYSFKTIAREVKKLQDFPQVAQWQALAELQDLYYRELESQQLWDPQAARNVAIHKQECATRRPIVLIGLVDINRGPREMLQQVADQVTVLTFCDPQDRAGFDALGCLVPDYWIKRRLRIPDSVIRIVDRPTDQARLVGEFLVKQRRRLQPHELAIGLPDDDVWRQVERETSRLGIATYYAKGLSLRSGAVMRLLQKGAEYLDDRSYQNFAELVRHPDISRVITERLGRNDWLEQLDEFQNFAIPAVVDLAKPEFFETPDLEGYPVADILRILAEVLRSVLPAERTVQDWARGWGDVLQGLYQEIIAKGPDELDPYERYASSAAGQISKSLAEIAKDNEATLLLASALEALQFCLQFIEDPYIEEVETSETVPVLGWLDLPLQDAQAMIVTGMNNHVVPQAETAFAFLPDYVSRQLGLLNPDRRLARDIYATSLLAACREDILFVVGRRNAKKDPLQISRLLLHASDEELIRRSRAFFDFDRLAASIDSSAVEPATSRPKQQRLVIPRPEAWREIRKLSVTRFRDYLKCPYRFYLTVALELAEVSDDLRELDGGAFGDLAHNVLEKFGRSAVRDSDDPKVIREYLQDTLHDEARPLLRRSQMPSLTLQVENLSVRLERFAECQARQRAEGWSIVAVENKFQYDFDVDGQTFTVVGKIDRVDRHEDGRIAVWDYKTSDSGKTAKEAHHKPRTGEWLDLQLPLYRYLVSHLYPEIDRDAVGLGYVLLPGATSKIKFDQASWTPADLQSADECALEVMRGILNNVFWPPNPEPPDYSEAFAAICQDNVFERWEIGESP